MSAKKIYVVLGMHRSGTSAITRGLQVLGVALGDRLMPQAPGNNEKGFWEDVDINRLNIDLLEYLGDDWDCLVPLSPIELQRPEIDTFRLRAIEILRNRLESTSVYGMKDPRISRLLPFWQSVFSHLGVDVSYIVACRNPMSVVRSLQARDGFALEKGYQLWLEYSIASLRDTKGQRSIVVDYDRLMEAPASQLSRISEGLGLEFDEESTAYAEYRNEFLEAGLRHSRFNSVDLKFERAATPAVVELFEILGQLATDEQSLDSKAIVEKIEMLNREQARNLSLLRFANSIKDLERKIANQKISLSDSQKDLAEQVELLSESRRVEKSINIKRADLEAEVESLALDIRVLTSERDNLILKVGELSTQVSGMHASLVEMRASTSWRVTEPLRSVVRSKRKVSKLLAALRFQLGRESLTTIVKKTIRVTRNEGLGGLKSRIYAQYTAARSRSGAASTAYPGIQPASLVRRRDATYELGPVSSGYTYLEPQSPPRLATVLESLKRRPKFSIVIPVFNTPETLLQAVLKSVHRQWYPDWEMILVDDASTDQATTRSLEAIADPKIKVIHLNENRGISGATNVAIEAATGEYIVFMDHDDELTVDCLYEMALCIEREDPDFIYSDEDKLSEAGEYIQPHFKPSWSPDTLMSTMYTCHASCVRRSLIAQIGVLRSEFDGCQDWDFVLRVSEQTKRISHIPRVLYHWRILPESVASNLAAKPYVIETSCRVREEALSRRGVEGKLEPVEQVQGHFRVNYKMRGTPLITIIIPTRDNKVVLQRCIDSIFRSSTYKQLQIIVLDNGSVDGNTLDYLGKLSSSGQAEIIRHDADFNFSELNNIGARNGRGELLLFLNDDTEVLCPDWLERLAGYAQLEHIGAVGAKLVYPGEKLVQHAGVLNLQDGPGHAFLRADRHDPGYFMRNLLEYNWLAVTGACLMIEAKKFKALNGFNEELPVAYNDIDLCMRAVKFGYYNVVCQAVTLIHHESVSRGIDHVDPIKHARLKRELRHLYDLNPEFFQYDPFFNVNLHPNGINFEVPN